MISKSTLNDIPQLLALVNSAYRGEESKKGWTTEAYLIQGDKRTDADDLEKLILQPYGTILKYVENDRIIGSVYLQKQREKLYLGMFSVQPDFQGKGIGKALLNAAIEQGIDWDCVAIRMNVISQRHELINWYQRNGYEMTGEELPFPDGNKFGEPVEKLKFLILEKKIK